MANDREILREIWEGKLPVCFQLDENEVYELQQPDPFFLMVPRLSYFPLVTDKVRKHFSRYVDNDKQDQEMWLDYNGQPVKWHFPIGVIFDLYMGSDIQLPWNITVHFDKFPESQIFRFSSRDIVEAHFMACIKEADFLKHRGQVVSSMQKKDHNQLWLGLQNDKFDQFWAVNRKLMEAPNDQDHFKYIPFRLYIDDGYRQRLVKPNTEDGRRKTLEDLLFEVFSDKTPYKMDIKKLILEYRELQDKRKKFKSVQNKMSSFEHVKFQKGAEPTINDVTIKVHQGVNITFSGNNFRYFIEDTLSSFNDDLANDAAVLLLFEDGSDDIRLEFANKDRKDFFLLALHHYLQLSNRSSPDTEK